MSEEIKNMLTEIRDGAVQMRGEISRVTEKLDPIEERLARVEEFNKRRIAEHGGRPPQIRMGHMLRGWLTGNWEGAEFEKEIFGKSSDYARELGRTSAVGERALGMGTIGAGGFLVPAVYLQDQLIDALTARIVCAQLGATMLGGLTGAPVYIPRVATEVAGGWNPENHEKKEEDISGEQLELNPHEAAVFCYISNRLNSMSQPGVLDLVAGIFARALGRLVDSAALRGNGAGAQPVGITNYPGVGTQNLFADAGNGAVPTPRDIYDIMLALETANADVDQSKLGWACSPRTWNTIRQFRDNSGGANTGQFMFQEWGMYGENQRRLVGLPIVATTQIPNNLVKGASGPNCSEIIYGNWSDLIIAEWGGLEVATSTEFRFTSNQITIRASRLVDIGLRHPLSFVYVNGVLP